MVERRKVQDILDDPKSKIHLDMSEFEAAWRKEVDQRSASLQSAKDSYSKLKAGEEELRKTALIKANKIIEELASQRSTVGDLFQYHKIGKDGKPLPPRDDSNPFDRHDAENQMSADTVEKLKDRSTIGDLYRYRKKTRRQEED